MEFIAFNRAVASSCDIHGSGLGRNNITMMAAKFVAYKCVARPLHKYACQVWSSYAACS